MAYESECKVKAPVPPEAFEDMAESQRHQDVLEAERLAVRHKARDALAEGNPIHLHASAKGAALLRWNRAYAWFVRFTKSADPRVVDVMRTAVRLVFVRQSGEVDAWHIEAANERGVIFRDVIPTARFYASWQTETAAKFSQGE